MPSYTVSSIPDVEYDVAIELYWGGTMFDVYGARANHTVHGIGETYLTNEVNEYSHHWGEIFDDIEEANDVDEFDEGEFLGIALLSDDEYHLEVATYSTTGGHYHRFS